MAIPGKPEPLDAEEQSAMSIQVHCRCGKKITVPDRLAGRSGTCKSCGAKLLVPELVTASVTRPPADDFSPPPVTIASKPLADDFASTAVPPPFEDEVLYSERPAMFRSRPFLFSLGLLFMVGASLGLLAGDAPADTKKGFAVILAAIGFLYLRWWLACANTRLTITRKKVSLRKGLLARALNEVRIADVRNVQTTQGILQRLLGVGSVGISTAGQSEIEIEVAGIPRPDRVRAIIDQQRG